jgi:uncharacterized membrane protein
MILTTAIVCTLIGLITGAIGAVLARVDATADRDRLDTLEAMGWYIGHFGDHWAVLRDVGGTPMMVGGTAESLRGAIDSALGVV